MCVWEGGGRGRCWCFKLTFSKIPFRNIIRVPNSFDPDQAKRLIGPDVGPHCLQSYQATTKMPLAGKELIYRSFCDVLETPWLIQSFLVIYMLVIVNTHDIHMNV